MRDKESTKMVTIKFTRMEQGMQDATQPSASSTSTNDI